MNFISLRLRRISAYGIRLVQRLPEALVILVLGQSLRMADDLSGAVRISLPVFRGRNAPRTPDTPSVQSRAADPVRGNRASALRADRVERCHDFFEIDLLLSRHFSFPRRPLAQFRRQHHVNLSGVLEYPGGLALDAGLLVGH